ncbi:hypothetical protein EYC84_003251 [Monilinia fructicola]|uniref:Uncharacterized protein n=1 Tax=Monilinia fructicola TaxID=38448 RepID=A0A5M9JXM8_MONFR|nr:hypothetical protein EYC84_003251 [Monilinia fructicola]
MNDRSHLRSSRSQGHFHRRRPDDIYIRNPPAHTFAYSSVEQLALTPDFLIDREEEKEDTILSMQTPKLLLPSTNVSSSPRNFFLEKPPADWDSEQSPISPGVTMLLSPASCLDGDGVDLEVMEFFQTATYAGAKTFADNTQVVPRSLNENKKKSTPKIGLPSPKTPQAWSSTEEPDISTLPPREVVERNILEARLKLTGQVTSNEKPLDFEESEFSPKKNPLEAYLVAPRPMRGRKQTKSPLSDVKQTEMSPECGQCHTLPVDHPRRNIESKRSLSQSRQQLKPSPSGNNILRSTRSQKSMLEPTPAMHPTISRTPSPAFDFDDSDITDIESDTEFDERGNERLSRCETLSSQDPHSPMFDRPPQPLEKDWKFRLQQDYAMGTLGTPLPPSIFSSGNQPPRDISKLKNRKIDEVGLPHNNATYPKDYTKGTRISRPRQHSAESSIHSSTSHIVPPPRRNSPPITAPIHQDQMKERGASFEPESRTPRTLVSNWLSSISSNAGRKEPSREQDVFWKKTRSWGRKTKPKMESWI